MKNLYLSFFLLIFINSVYSQTNNYEKLSEVYGITVANEIIEKNRNKVIYYDVLFNNSYVILKSDKANEFEDIYKYDLYDQILEEQPNSTILPLQNDLNYFLSHQFNLLRFQLYRDIKKEMIYKIGDTGYVIKLISTTHLNQLYNSKISVK